MEIEKGLLSEENKILWFLSFVINVSKSSFISFYSSLILYK